MGVKYKPGMKVGPKNILFISEIPKEQRKTLQYREGMFLCPDCGKPFRARLANVVSGNTSRCLAHRSEIMAQTMSKDITGQRFGRLTALKWTKEYSCSQRIWLCKCDCGNYTKVAVNNLISGNTKSCGCLHKEEISKKSMKDLTNQRFGKLVAIAPTEKRIDGRVIWKCKCDCGNYAYISSHHLINGDTESCGCISSKGEALLQNILQELHLTFKSQKTFNDCINPQTGKRLRFDFYLPDYNCCIEYDGEQHFSYAKTKNTWNNKQNFDQQLYRDNLKNDYCVNKNIKLIRIPYTDYNKLNKEYIKGLLDEQI